MIYYPQKSNLIRATAVNQKNQIKSYLNFLCAYFPGINITNIEKLIGLCRRNGVRLQQIDKNLYISFYIIVNYRHEYISHGLNTIPRSDSQYNIILDSYNITRVEDKIFHSIDFEENVPKCLGFIPKYILPYISQYELSGYLIRQNFSKIHSKDPETIVDFLPLRAGFMLREERRREDVFSRYLKIANENS